MKVTVTVGHNVGDGRAIRWTGEDVIDEFSNSCAVECATAFECVGVWQGQREDSTRIECACDARTAARIRRRSFALSARLMQDSVFVELQTARTYTAAIYQSDGAICRVA